MRSQGSPSFVRLLLALGSLYIAWELLAGDTRMTKAGIDFVTERFGSGPTFTEARSSLPAGYQLGSEVVSPPVGLPEPGPRPSGETPSPIARPGQPTVYPQESTSVAPSPAGDRNDMMVAVASESRIDPVSLVAAIQGMYLLENRTALMEEPVDAAEWEAARTFALGLHDTIATSDPPLLPFLSNPPTETLAQRLFGTFFSDTRRDSAGKIRPSGLTILEEFGPAKRDELVRRAMAIYYANVPPGARQ